MAATAPETGTDLVGPGVHGTDLIGPDSDDDELGMHQSDMMSLFVYRGRVYSIPVDSVPYNKFEGYLIGIDDFSERCSGWSNNAMNIDTFMSQQAVGSRGYDPKKIVVVETTLGYVWASRLTLMLPAASVVRLGLPNKGPTLVGRSFLWPWYPSKAVYAFEGEVEKTHLDGMFRELSQFEPTRAIINTNLLSPDIIKGAVDVTDKLCPGELAFFSMLAPSRAWVPPRSAEDDYCKRVTSYIDRKQAGASFRQASDPTSAEIIFQKAPLRLEDGTVSWNTEYNALAPWHPQEGARPESGWDVVSGRQRLSRKSFPVAQELLPPSKRTSSVAKKKALQEEQIHVFESAPEDVTRIVCSIIVSDALKCSNPVESLGVLAAFRACSKQLKCEIDSRLLGAFTSLTDDSVLPAPEDRITTMHIRFTLGYEQIVRLFHHAPGLARAEAQPTNEQRRAIFAYLQRCIMMEKSRNLVMKPDENARKYFGKVFKVDSNMLSKSFKKHRTTRFLSPSTFHNTMDTSEPNANDAELKTLLSYIQSLNPSAVIAAESDVPHQKQPVSLPRGLHYFADDGVFSEKANPVMFG